MRRHCRHLAMSRRLSARGSRRHRRTLYVCLQSDSIEAPLYVQMQNHSGARGPNPQPAHCILDNLPYRAMENDILKFLHSLNIEVCVLRTCKQYYSFPSATSH